MKKIIMFSVMAVSAVMFAIERPSAEWNAMVTRCAFDIDGASEQIKRLDSVKQPLFAVDIVKAITLYPNPREKILARLTEAIMRLTGSADGKIAFVVQIMAIDAVPEDFKTDVIFLLNKNINGVDPIITHQTPNSHSSIWNLYLSTNKTDNAVYVPQSDIGILRVPRPVKGRRKAGNPYMAEPTPYMWQSL